MPACLKNSEIKAQPATKSSASFVFSATRREVLATITDNAEYVRNLLRICEVRRGEQCSLPLSMRSSRTGQGKMTTYGWTLVAGISKGGFLVVIFCSGGNFGNLNDVSFNHRFVILRGAQLLEMGTLIKHHSFALPAGVFSLNILAIITLCRVHYTILPIACIK